MKEKKKLRKSFNKWKLLSIFLCILTIASVGAIIFYTLNIPMQFGVETTYGLELRQTNGTTVIESIDWGLIPKSGNKSLICHLYNTGNKDEVVNWLCTGYDRNAWEFTVHYWDANGALWIEDLEHLLIPRGQYKVICLLMKELNAVGGVQYSATLNFNVVS